MEKVFLLLFLQKKKNPSFRRLVNSAISRRVPPQPCEIALLTSLPTPASKTAPS